MDKKICFKCKIEKPISEFYVHKRMADGHLNKCKECTKTDVKLKYEENMQNIDYVEKERARGREKYKRLQYKNKYRKDYLQKTKHTNVYLKRRGIDLFEKEAHHWSYNKEYLKDVFILNRRAHKLVHKYLTHDDETNCFFIKETGKKLLTKKDHYNFMIKVFTENNVNYEIECFPEMLNY